ncbi:hypothetical protein B0E53_01313 [Micromonospora sp. MH33]|nr:hypothetical protein B0E53_01313 [Micromonospora sp. MH33]
MCAVTDEEVSFVLTTGETNLIEAWDTRDGSQVREMAGHYAPVAAVCPLTIDGEVLVASAGDDQVVRIWDPHTGTVRRVLLGHVTRAWVTALATVDWPGFEALASADKSGTVMLWTGGDTPLWTQQGHQDSVNALCGVTVAGRPALVSASADHAIRMWDAERGQPLRWFTGHCGPVTGLSLVKVGGRAMLASTSRDRTVRIWELTTGRLVRTIPVYHPALACCTVGDTLLVGLDQGMLALTITG